MIDKLLQANEYRNWLAHGRYWQFKDNISKFKFDNTSTLYYRLKDTLGNYMYPMHQIGEVK